MLTGFAINTASQYLHNNCQIILEKVIALLTLSASDCIGMENSPLFEGYRLFKLFFSSVLLFLGILPLAYIRKNLIIDNELYGLFFGNYVYLAHYLLITVLVLLIVHYLIKPVPVRVGKWLIAASLCTVTVVGYINYRYTDVVYTKISVDKIAQREQLRIAFISDLHLMPTSNKQLFVDMVAKINAENPDIIVFGGDIFQDSHTSVDEGYKNVLAELKAKHGVYSILGNHEYYGNDVDGNIAFIKNSGIEILHDEVLTLDGIRLIGRDDIGNKFAVTNRMSLKEIYERDNVQASDPIIVFDHNPVSIPESIENKADLQVSGHTHGGQFFPYNLLLRRMYPNVVGHKVIDGLHTIVSAGVGVGWWKIVGPWQMPYRLGTRGQINIIDVSFAGAEQGRQE